MSTPSAFACIGNLADVEAAYRACAQVTPRIERHPNALVLDLHGSEQLLLGERATGTENEWPQMADTLYRVLAESHVLFVSGKVERSGREHVSVLAQSVRALPPDIGVERNGSESKAPGAMAKAM